MNEIHEYVTNWILRVTLQISRNKIPKFRKVYKHLLRAFVMKEVYDGFEAVCRVIYCYDSFVECC